MENLRKHTDNHCTFNSYNGKTSHKLYYEYLVAPDWHMQVFSKKISTLMTECYYYYYYYRYYTITVPQFKSLESTQQWQSHQEHVTSQSKECLNSSIIKHWYCKASVLKNLTAGHLTFFNGCACCYCILWTICCIMHSKWMITINNKSYTWVALRSLHN